MNNKKIIYLLFFAVGLYSCSGSKKASTTSNKETKMDTITTASGLKYIITHKANTGKKAAQGDKVVAHYTGRLLNDTIFDSSVQRAQPFSFKLGVGQVIKGWDEGFSLLEVGDKARLIIPAELGYGARDLGKIPANSTLIFDVELLDVVQKITPKPFDVAGKDTLTTASGLKYIVVKEGTGAKAVKTKMATVHYTGYLLDGKTFDSSVERGEPFNFPLGMGRVIKGWDEGVALMSVGSKYRFIIPSGLAYGDRGMPPVIPPAATLIFDVELFNVGQ